MWLWEVEFEVLTVTDITLAILWDVAPCRYWPIVKEDLTASIIMVIIITSTSSYKRNCLV